MDSCYLKHLAAGKNANEINIPTLETLEHTHETLKRSVQTLENAHDNFQCTIKTLKHALVSRERSSKFRRYS